jgi:diaminopimelate decarboxylase
VILSFLDIGGGFASHNKLKAQYLPGEQASPSLRPLRRRDAPRARRARLPRQRSEPTIVLETGRALVDDAGSLIATVAPTSACPTASAGSSSTRASTCSSPSFWYDHDVVPAQPFGGLSEPTVMYGPLCMNIDVVRDTCVFPPMRRSGDRWCSATSAPTTSRSGCSSSPTAPRW